MLHSVCEGPDEAVAVFSRATQLLHEGCSPAQPCCFVQKEGAVWSSPIAVLVLPLPYIWEGWLRSSLRLWHLCEGDMCSLCTAVTLILLWRHLLYQWGQDYRPCSISALTDILQPGPLWKNPACRLTSYFHPFPLSPPKNSHHLEINKNQHTRISNNTGVPLGVPQ